MLWLQCLCTGCCWPLLLLLVLVLSTSLSSLALFNLVVLPLRVLTISSALLSPNLANLALVCSCMCLLERHTWTAGPQLTKTAVLAGRRGPARRPGGHVDTVTAAVWTGRYGSLPQDWILTPH